MKKYLLHIVLFFCIIQLADAQENGVVAFNIPARNSLKFNKQFINPTFSFVREQNKYISFNNKREWVQFDNAPQTYLFGYSGRFRENIGAGISLYQQNYGVLTTFGGVANFAYNAVLDRDSNLTFGVNLGFYKSGINTGNVITNFPDSSLDNFPSNSIITISPGINYGTSFFDFGASIKNLASYNLVTSRIIEDDPEQAIQAHIMYTGYFNTRGFFDESRFSGLISSEFRKDQTVVSGMVMLLVPKGIWAQAGYNSLYALSAGVGLNISSQISIEYNYEKGVGGFSTFGSSHDFTLAYKFNNKYRYNYSGDDEEEALLIASKKKTKALAKRRKSTKTRKKTQEVISENKNIISEGDKVEEQEGLGIEKLKSKQETQVKLAEEARVKALEEEQIRIAEAARLKEMHETQAKLTEEARIKALEEEQTRVAEAARLKEAQETQAKLAEEARVKALEEEQTRVTETARLKEAQETQVKLEEETRVKALEEEQKRIKTEKESEIKEIALDEVLVKFKKSTKESNNAQQVLFNKLNDKVVSKQQDLDNLKEENDLSEKGVVSAPKAFKSVSAENAEIESLKLKIDNSIEFGKVKISEIETLYKERLKKVKAEDDSINIEYIKTIEKLKSEQLQAENIKRNLMTSLNDIKLATDFERNRRIKRAAYDNEDDRYKKDRAALANIKKFTEPSETPLTKDDFDYGDPLSNIQIVKDINNTESGYYLVVAVHSDVTKRDDFLKKAVSAGQKDINFFFDVNTSKYYIYYEKFNNIGQAKNALDTNKGNKVFNGKMAMVKIEN